MMSWYSAERKKRKRRREEGKIKKSMESKVDGIMDVFSPLQLLLTDQWRLRHVEAMWSDAKWKFTQATRWNTRTHIHTRAQWSLNWNASDLWCLEAQRGAGRLEGVLWVCMKTGRVFRLLWKEWKLYEVVLEAWEVYYGLCWKTGKYVMGCAGRLEEYLTLYWKEWMENCIGCTGSLEEYQVVLEECHCTLEDWMYIMGCTGSLEECLGTMEN